MFFNVLAGIDNAVALRSEEVEGFAEGLFDEVVFFLLIGYFVEVESDIEFW